jgi:hypothetical protein
MKSSSSIVLNQRLKVTSGPRSAISSHDPLGVVESREKSFKRALTTTRGLKECGQACADRPAMARWLVIDVGNQGTCTRSDLSNCSKLLPQNLDLLDHFIGASQQRGWDL